MASKEKTNKTKASIDPIPETPAAPAPKKSKGILGLVLCFLLSVSASLGGAYFLSAKPDPTAEANKTQEQTKQLDALKQTIADQNKAIQAIKEENDTLKLYLRHSSATAVKNIMINQEDNIQAYLKVMKAAMNDLSKLTPGTIDWNNKYQYQLDLALKGSLEREDLLKMLKTGEPNDK